MIFQIKLALNLTYLWLPYELFYWALSLRLLASYAFPIERPMDDVVAGVVIGLSDMN